MRVKIGERFKMTAAFMTALGVEEVDAEGEEVAEEEEASATEANERDGACRHATNTRQKREYVAHLLNSPLVRCLHADTAFRDNMETSRDSTSQMKDPVRQQQYATFPEMGRENDFPETCTEVTVLGGRDWNGFRANCSSSIPALSHQASNGRRIA